ncbi:Aste57867_25102 [Aphanomyces stellatus]|uniref:Aste57867_25102 protein n=1 Tax=Aphanomyces stellatus TaxID=120398 RepID=A0A485LSA0_9STRA|nr:hypothetical protein As57867_025024 [Aphanomyces stellatus]VFU01733.1 Aste57867_25102 [Aphanomyces stellatus]
MQLAGFDASTSTFVLVSAADGSTLRRTFVDFQTWDRYLHKKVKSMEHLPTKRFKHLMAISWTRDGLANGQHLALTKNIEQCQKWIQSAFARLPLDMQRTFVDDMAYAALQREAAARLARNKAAKDLGQYFSPPSSVAMLLDAVFALPSISFESALFLEPSCGVGRFFQPLVDRGAKRILGYELDATVAATAAAALPSAHVISLDFLKSTNPETGRGDVIVVGNPPFSSPDSDIVLDFFGHCAEEWHAKAIAFILPERCAKPMYMESILAKLTCAFVCHHVAPIPESHFDFQGQRINKPSVILIYTRVDYSDGPCIPPFLCLEFVPGH